MEMLLVHYGFLLLLLLLFTRVECAVSFFIFRVCPIFMDAIHTFKTIILIVSSILLR